MYLYWIYKLWLSMEIIQITLTHFEFLNKNSPTKNNSKLSASCNATRIVQWLNTADRLAKLWNIDSGKTREISLARKKVQKRERRGARARASGWNGFWWDNEENGGEQKIVCALVGRCLTTEFFNFFFIAPPTSLVPYTEALSVAVEK